MQRPRSQEDRFEPWWQIWRTALPEDLYPTAWVGQRAVAYIEEAATVKEPFFLQVSFPDPHHPFTPPGRYYDLYDPADIPLPATFDDAHETSVPHLQTWRATRGAEPPAFPVMPFSPTEAIYREAAAKEYGAITMIDATVGTILDALERTGCATDTVVVFTSDHGEMFGDHGLMLKGAMHYLPALRVPLLIADPRRADNHATVDSSLVGSIDLASTILDLTGTPVYAGMQGHSLVPRLDGDAGLVHDEVLVEEDEPFDLAGVGQPLRMRTLITDTTRLTIYQGAARGELLDLARDPGETRNLWDDPGRRELRADMTERLARSVIEHAEQGTIPTHGA